MRLEGSNGHALSGVRVDGVAARSGSKIGIETVLSGIPEGACACGAEGRIALC